MTLIKELICPVSPDRLDENRVRVTALGVVIIMGGFFITGIWLFPALLVVDFCIRAFTRLPYSPLSWMAEVVVKLIGAQRVQIDKAPKVFAARIGFILSFLTTMGALLDWSLLAFITGSVLGLFAFLECGLNFCMGCRVYTYLVYPLVRKDHE